MTNKEAIEIIKVARAEVEWEYPMEYAAAFDRAIKALEQDWIPVKFHQATEEEIKEEGYPFDVCFIFDNSMPYDEQEILITTRYKNKRTGEVTYSVEKDVCYCDDGYSLDSGYDWLTDVAAWREMPEPYKAESEG